MITLHIRDEYGIFLGSVTVDEMGPLPERSVAQAPPILTGTQVARWNGDGWDVMAARPAQSDGAVAPTQAEYTAALEATYDAKAAERGYDSRLTCALRAGYAGPFQKEATVFAIWMDSCNAKAYSIMGQVLRGEIKYPTVVALLAMMPTMAWPQ
ncbi:hypothetical protein RBA41_28745 [Massilia sp. CCM 9210]|uniref:hypothetical protein n=1 Tax=Massilia scottii TaxID=3057166 RepID=UPI0027969369|nr:hypothetical protein [Massilia sp. CCM 9210]MDQ1817301.1 hypothetical protein [Massilia sp. CCM 9210]